MANNNTVTFPVRKTNLDASVNPKELIARSDVSIEQETLTKLRALLAGNVQDVSSPSASAPQMAMDRLIWLATWRQELEAALGVIQGKLTALCDSIVDVVPDAKPYTSSRWPGATICRASADGGGSGSSKQASVRLTDAMLKTIPGVSPQLVEQLAKHPDRFKQPSPITQTLLKTVCKADEKEATRIWTEAKKLAQKSKDATEAAKFSIHVELPVLVPGPTTEPVADAQENKTVDLPNHFLATPLLPPRNNVKPAASSRIKMEDDDDDDDHHRQRLGPKKMEDDRPVASASASSGYDSDYEYNLMTGKKALNKKI